MTDDTTPTGQGHDPDRMSVQEAAARLGVTPDAIRARIRRGTLEAVKDGGVYVVLLPHDTGQDADTTATERDTTDDTPPAALVAQLQSEVEYLRSELTAAREQAAKERERADVLQREALDRLQSMIPIALGPPGSSESVDTVSHGLGVGEGDKTPTGQGQDATGGLLGWLRRLISG